MQRPPVTEAEKQALKNLVAALATAETFYCGGTARYAGLPKPTLMYTTDAGAEALSITKSSDNDLDKLHGNCIASHFGQGQDRVMDLSYRLARELLADSFGLNFNPISDDTGILAAISAFCKGGVVAKLYKLNSYTTGGHFKIHKDTPKSEDHIGTLLIGLPAPFKGGELLLEHGDQKTTIDWSDTHPQLKDDTLSLPWTFFYSDVEHEISPVISGHRLTLAYDIYSSKFIQYYQRPPHKALEVGEAQFYKEFKAFLKNPQLLPNGGVLAFGLAYEYPLASVSNSPHVENVKLLSELEEPQRDGSADSVQKHLDLVNDASPGSRILAMVKGSDAVLYRALTESKLNFQVKAVYKEELDVVDKRDSTPVDEFSCVINPDQYQPDVLLTADDFSGIWGEYYSEDDETKLELLQSELGAKIGWSIIWVKTPEKFRVASTFASYGNEPSIDHTYVSAALLVDLPPVVNGRREGC
ncbi:hypothetical protein FRB96_003613 [Tulasnella sp. 330]|nr:hypothetical protein FRB96_003613 [Tulasnella sp. 330]KAG8883088.1 hypothetical protein FRB98_003326 [Tulasnella sp. 332]KAG8886207.1 hypothetical protein FRB97_006210 [Tulasnella sp. 331]